MNTYLFKKQTRFFALLAVLALFSQGPPDTGWTFYVPFSISTRTDVSLTVFAAFILGMSSILTGLNFITTIHRLRVNGMGWFQMPLFTWSIYANTIRWLRLWEWNDACIFIFCSVQQASVYCLIRFIGH